MSKSQVTTVVASVLVTGAASLVSARPVAASPLPVTCPPGRLDVEGTTGLPCSAQASPAKANARARAARRAGDGTSFMAEFGSSTRPKYTRDMVLAPYASIRPAGLAYPFDERDDLAR